MWYALWNTVYLPQLLLRPKWHQSSEAISEDDLVLFKKTESGISTEWVLGKVEQVKTGRDGQVRECVILYKSTGETDRMIIVERPVREVVKLFNIDDTTLYEEIDRAREICKNVLQSNSTLCSDNSRSDSPNLLSDELINHATDHKLDRPFKYVSHSEGKIPLPDCYIRQIEALNECPSLREDYSLSWNETMEKFCGEDWRSLGVEDDPLCFI